MYPGAEMIHSAASTPQSTSPGALLTSPSEPWRQQQVHQGAYSSGQPLEDVPEESDEDIPPQGSWATKPSTANSSTEALYSASTAASFVALQSIPSRDFAASSDPHAAATRNASLRAYHTSLRAVHFGGLNRHFRCMRAGLTAELAAESAEPSSFFENAWANPHAIASLPSDLPTPPESCSTQSLSFLDSATSLVGGGAGRGYTLTRAQAISEYRAIQGREAARKEAMVEGNFATVMDAVVRDRGEGPGRCKGAWRRTKKALGGAWRR